MRRIIVIGGIVVAVLAAGWAYMTYVGTESAAPAEPVDTDQVDDLENVIWASGTLEPVRFAGLSPAQTGIVRHIYVSEGDRVAAGDLLVELDGDVAAAQVESAAANVAEAEAALAKLRAGATAAEITAAEAEVAAAEAQVALAAGQMLEAEAAITQAEAQAQIARDQYAELAGHPTQAELTATDADVAVAQTTVNHAQAAFNLVRGDPQIASLPESLALYQATAGLEAAQAKADLTRQGPTPEQLAVANSQIDAADAAVEMARSRTVGAQAAVQAAMAAQSGAQAALDDLHDGATAEEIAMAEARVLSAQASLSMAQATLRQSRIVAPFDGQVGQIDVKPGEMATPEQSAILLGDPAVMHVATTDLRETDVVRLRVGMTVEVTFDALPDRIFTGTITEIAPVSNTEKGSTNYTVKIDVADLDPALRWGMTAFVNIQAPR